MVYTGNLFSPNPGDAYNVDNQFIYGHNGRNIYRAVGIGILTEALQTSIPVLVYAPRNKELASQYPNKNIVLPIGAQVLSTSLRLPSAKRQGDQKQWGAQLDPNTTIIGTSTDVLKVSFGANNTFAANKTASIAAAGGVYALGASNRIARGSTNAADDATGILNTLTSVSTVNLVVDNAANSAAGTGIRLSTATGQRSAIAVDIMWSFLAAAVDYTEFPNLTQNFIIRS